MKFVVKSPKSNREQKLLTTNPLKLKLFDLKEQRKKKKENEL
jgi:hypothetical protein